MGVGEVREGSRGQYYGGWGGEGGLRGGSIMGVGEVRGGSRGQYYGGWGGEGGLLISRSLE